MIAALLFVACTQLQTAAAQWQSLVVKDTSASMLVIHPDLPTSASVVVYSSLPHLVIESSIELLDTSYNPSLGEYMITMRPNTAHRLTIQYPGFQPYELRIPPTESGDTRFFSIDPPRPFISGKLVVEATPFDAEISVHGIAVGRGSVQLDLTPGNHPVRIHKEGYDPVEFFADIDFNESNVQRRSISPAKQAITVTATMDGARVYVQGREIGVTPVNDFLVEQGLVEVRVERTGYDPFVQMIDVRCDRENRVHAVMETQVTMLPSASVYVQHASAAIENEVLVVRYDLAAERKKYTVDVAFLGPDNQPLRVPGLYGDFGKNTPSGNGHTIYWPIPEGYSLNGVKVQVNAQPKSKAGWLVGGGLGLGGGIAIAVLSGWGNQSEGGSGPPPGGR